MMDLVPIEDGREEIKALISTITPPKEGDPGGVFYTMRKGCGERLYEIGLKSKDFETVNEIRVALSKNGFCEEARVLGAKMDTMERINKGVLRNPLSRPPARASSPPERISGAPMHFKLK